MSQIATLPKRSLVDSMAAKYDMEPGAFVNAIKATVIKGDCSNEQFAAFLMVAKEYDLNPLTKEIYAFPDRGGITPIVSIDGWMNLINSHPQFDGMEFTDTHGDDGKLYSVECRMYRKDRARPVSVIEYMSECFRQTDPWKKWPNRMLRHKSAIQCARYAFGFSGIMEPDEYERMKDVTPATQPTVAERLRANSASQQPQEEQEGFSRSFVAEQTDEPHDALTGEIIEPDTGEDTPAPPVTDDLPPSSVNEGDGVAAQQPSPSNPLPEELRKTLMDFARNASKIVEETSLSEDAKEKTLNKMVLNYQDVINQPDWGKLEGITIALNAVLFKGRPIEKARDYIARDLLDCRVDEIGGEIGGEA